MWDYRAVDLTKVAASGSSVPLFDDDGYIEPIQKPDKVAKGNTTQNSGWGNELDWADKTETEKG